LLLTSQDIGRRMKCRACWAEKAYVRQVSGWRGILHKVCFLVPLKCHHCYFKFAAFWPTTVGQQITPPVLRVSPSTASLASEPAERPAVAAAAMQRRAA
jgi:hypothetical protein